MKKLSLIASASALAIVIGAPVFAQTEFSTGANITGVGGVEDRLDDVEEAVQDDFERSQDAARFGPADRRTGTFGSIALTYAGRSGNYENQDFSLAGRLSNNQGPFQQSVGLLLEYGEDNDGETDTKRTSVIYDGNYFFNEQLYAFVLGRAAVDGIADDDLDTLAVDDPDEFADRDGRLKRDAFLGFGPGYRVINNDTTAWRVQAGVGIRYTHTVRTVSALPDAAYVESDTSVGYIASSRFYHKFNDQFFLTNDTDYLTSDANDIAWNELGLNFKMSDALATRVSYKTEYVSDRAIRTDNTLGVSLVYGF
ncbi:putative salt-induced outer membrane protein [Paracoccus solventivorans]|uniref:Putative salt-induced outer membrane protein n=1 Tax=Paracoccus solventivorans TaxID=53463 RepID=A0A1M7FW12_9RHOB|nr:DUF481 domain-containing protein [Paracoccus solventivorans]SHM08312.1 putative salt-induced outer membrane protein [Paracoccus solventivorans]